MYIAYKSMEVRRGLRISPTETNKMLCGCRLTGERWPSAGERTKNATDYAITLRQFRDGILNKPQTVAAVAASFQCSGGKILGIRMSPI